MSRIIGFLLLFLLNTSVAIGAEELVCKVKAQIIFDSKHEFHQDLQSTFGKRFTYVDKIVLNTQECLFEKRAFINKYLLRLNSGKLKSKEYTDLLKRIKISTDLYKFDRLYDRWIDEIHFRKGQYHHEKIL